MKKLFAVTAATLGVAAFAPDASASGCASPFCGGQGAGWHPGGLFMKSPLPAFQAAPWYLYWPYNAHFMTPAPLTGPYYAPPYSGGALVNPYFPAQPVAPVPPPGGVVPLPPAGTLPPTAQPVPLNGNGNGANQ